MTSQETAALMAVLRTAYPAFYKGQTLEEAKMAVQLWDEMLGEYPAEIVTGAVKAFISTGGSYPPSIGQIKDLIRKITEPEEMTEQEAWAIVRRAISNSGYHALEEFEKLPPELKRAVHSPEQLKAWAIDEDFNEGVVSSNFMRSYRAQAAQEREWAALPEDVKKLAIGARKAIGSLPGRREPIDWRKRLEEMP